MNGDLEIRKVDLDYCPICGGELEEATLHVNEPVDDHTRIEVAVQGMRCKNCGEEYYHDDALRRAQMLAKQMQAANEQILDVSELAAYLRTHENTIYSMLKANRLPAFKVGREWRFRKAAIDTLLERYPEEQAAATYDLSSSDRS